MTETDGHIASQSYGSTQIWSTVYQMSGTVKVLLKDVTITAEDVALGGSYVVKFDYVDYWIGLYWRSGANSTVVAGKVIRKYWGQPLDWITLGSVASGSYSFETSVEKLVTGGNVISGSPGYNAWVKGTFNAIY